MNFQHVIFKKNPRKLYCHNPGCSTNDFLSKEHGLRTLLSINIFDPNSKVKERRAFYVCKKCGEFSDFEKMPFSIEMNNNMKIRIIPYDYLGKFYRIMTKRGIQKCLFCKQEKIITKESRRTSETTSQLVNVIKPCVYKLFVKRWRYIGYLCGSCRYVYFTIDFRDFKYNLRETRYCPLVLEPLAKAHETKEEMEAKYDTVTLLETEGKTISPSVQESINTIKLWRKIQLEPIKKEDWKYIDFLYLGEHHMGGINEPKDRRHIRIWLEVPKKTALKLLKKYGTDYQKELLSRRDLVGVSPENI